MTTTVIGKSYHPPGDACGGLAWAGGEVWMASAGNGQIFRARETAAALGAADVQVPAPTKNPGGLAWDGRHFYVADRLAKIVLRVDPETGLAVPTLDLQELDAAGTPMIFRMKDSQVADLAWGAGLLWATCMAGYSSSVYAIDLQSRRVARHIRARGPKPEGIAFDHQEEYFWTLDSRNREFSQFTPQGEWTEEALSSPVARPFSLALDDQDAFWTMDRDTNDVVQILREG